MLSTVAQKLQFLYKPYALAVVSVGYVLGELGHYLIGKQIQFCLTYASFSLFNDPRKTRLIEQTHLDRTRRYASRSPFE